MLFRTLYPIYLLIATTLTSQAAVVPHDEPYYKHTQDNVEIIYTKNNLPFAKQTASVEGPLNESYEELYDWELDETLYVGLISCNNQIANGFSTQWPNNRQINYVGGAMRVDYFSSTSWLHTLLYHETAHNYQLNVKGSSVSRALHSVFGNGDVILPLPLIVPNVMENPFMLEGNAVLNESWHGNGGRLYSGRLKAQTILQAKAGKLKASELYNSKLEFPYGDVVYIQGAFYNLFLAKKYGVEKLNKYFKNHSEDFWWPQFTNASMEETIDMDFESSIEEFSQHYIKLSEKFVVADGEHIASSQFFTPLSDNQEEVFFITNESGVDTPELVVFDKKSLEIKKAQESWLPGKVIKTDGEYYTQGSSYISPFKIAQGLFCNQAYIKEGSDSKVIHGYLKDKRVVYFDVNSSFSQPQLYIGEEFYAQVNSSVYIDKEDNLYYFKQDKKTRTLYKNKTPLYSYKGFYGIVSGVDTQGKIYFIANSELGSTLYALDELGVKRVSKADNIVEAKLVDDTKVLLAVIGEESYYYLLNAIEAVDEEPYETKLFFEDEKYYGKYYKSQMAIENYGHIDLSHEYTSFLDMHYSGSSLGLGVSTDGSLLGALNVKFADPLSQNSLNAFVSRDASKVSIAGVGYSNSQYLLNYTLSAYGVIENDSVSDTRDYGFMFSSSLPFYKSGYLSGALGLSYFQDYSTLEREPLSATLMLMTHKQHGVSMYSNYLNYLQLYSVSERGDLSFGAEYKFKHDLVNEFYVGLGAKYSYSDALSPLGLRGVKLSNLNESMDPSGISMPSLETSLYVKEAGYTELSLEKVFNFSSYFFTFPLSLQREALYGSYRYYNLESFSGNNYDANELRLGLMLSTVFLNSFVVPLSFEYIYNDAVFVDNKHGYRFVVNLAF